LISQKNKVYGFLPNKKEVFFLSNKKKLIT